MLESLITPVSNLLNKFIPDADVKQKIAHEIATMSERHAQEVEIPQADTSVMMPILMGLLGLGGMRSFEKTKNIQGK